MTDTHTQTADIFEIHIQQLLYLAKINCTDKADATQNIGVGFEHFMCGLSIHL